MSDRPVLLFLHGIGAGDQEERWREVLSTSLEKAGYPSLSKADVRAPRYPNALNGVDPEKKLPDARIKLLTGGDDQAKLRAFELRMSSMEARLGGQIRGAGFPLNEQVREGAVQLKFARQARNYLGRPKIRAYVQHRILAALPTSGEILIVAHSLGSVIAFDLLRRLPKDLSVTGLVTIGSPLSSSSFNVYNRDEDRLSPPANLGWWVNVWNSRDPVPGGHGVSARFPWALDQRIESSLLKGAHEGVTYLASPTVAKAVGYGLFGSLTTELVAVNRGLEIPGDPYETQAVVALKYAHLVLAHLEGERAERFEGALRLVQAETYRQMIRRIEEDRRLVPASVAEIFFDDSDPTSPVPVPDLRQQFSKEELVSSLVSVEATNVVNPFEISIPKEVRLKAMKSLLLELGFNTSLASEIFDAAEEADLTLRGSSKKNLVRIGAVGLGLVALAVGTGGVALAAAPGAYGAAAVTSALAAFGPGGMIGGLITAGSLVSAGGGGIAFGLSSSSMPVEAVEAASATQLSSAIVRSKLDLEQDGEMWSHFSQNYRELQRELTKLQPFSDKAAQSTKDLKKKIVIVERVLAYLEEHNLGGAPVPDDSRV